MPPTQQDIDDLDTLKAARSRVLALLNTLLQSPKLNYNIDGQIFTWTEYQEMLFRQLKGYDDAIGRRRGMKVLWLGKRCYPRLCVCSESLA